MDGMTINHIVSIDHGSCEPEHEHPYLSQNQVQKKKGKFLAGSCRTCCLAKAIEKYAQFDHKYP